MCLPGESSFRIAGLEHEFLQRSIVRMPLAVEMIVALDEAERLGECSHRHENEDTAGCLARISEELMEGDASGAGLVSGGC